MTHPHANDPENEKLYRCSSACRCTPDAERVTIGIYVIVPAIGVAYAHCADTEGMQTGPLGEAEKTRPVYEEARK